MYTLGGLLYIVYLERLLYTKLISNLELNILEE